MILFMKSVIYVSELEQRIVDSAVEEYKIAALQWVPMTGVGNFSRESHSHEFP